MTLPTEKVNALWVKASDDAEGMRLGYTMQHHYFAALIQQQMEAENVCICGYTYAQHTYDKSCDSHGVCPNRQGVFRNERQHELIQKLDAENAELRKDAERYRWLRDRMQVRNLSAVSGRTSPALAVRVGFEFLDTKTDPKRGWTNPKYFDEQRAELDTAIDQARSANDT